MNYSGIKHCDLTDGPGIRVTLYVSGCSNHCDGCHNPETWDPQNGNNFTSDELHSIIHELRKPFISGFTLCGGDPLYCSNIKPVSEIVEKIKQEVPDKSIWMYTGYTLDQVKEMISNNPYVKKIISHIDVILEGPYIKELKTINKHWVGSTNQNVLDVIHNSDGTFNFKLHED